MSWMDSWSRPSKSQATPAPLYLTTNGPVPYCHSCGRVISSRRTQTSKVKTQEVKYCSARCRNTKPGPVDRRIEKVFAALLDGASVESLKEEGREHLEGGEEKAAKKTEGKGKEKAGKNKKMKFIKGDPRIIVECTTVEEVVFQHEKDPRKVFGRRKNRAPRGIVEKPEDWRSVDMVDDAVPAPKDSVHSRSADEDQDSSSVSSEEEDEGGIALSPKENRSDLPDSVPLQPTYGFGAGQIRPPQSQSSINGSIGGEKGWAERIEETDEMKAKRREGQRRADEREMVRRAARRLVAFGVTGEEDEKKCEAVMKGAVVEASFAKGEWGIRWREKV